MARDHDEGTAEHESEEARSEAETSRNRRRDSGPRDRPQSEHVAGAPDTAERDTPLKADQDE